MNEPSDGDLLRGAKEYNLQALAAVYDRFSPELYAYAMRLLGDPCLAEDCVADTFSRFLKVLSAGRGPDDHLRAYLYRIAHNWITDQYRRQPPPPEPVSEELSAGPGTQTETLALERMEQERMRLMLRLLTPEQRQVIVLRFLQDWSNEEVAAALQKPVGAVKAAQHRALAALRKWCLEDEKGDVHALETGN